MNIRYEIHDRTAVVTIDRPARRNAVDVDTQGELYAAFERFEADQTLDVAILTGAGGHFCAGADLRAMAEGRRKLYDEGAVGPMGPTRMRLTKPVIAAIEGYAVAGGAELALWCDLRVMAEGATFGIFCRRFGVPLIDLGTVRLPRLIGHSRAMDLILTGRPVGAAEAERIGLANRIAPQGKALEVAPEHADALHFLGMAEHQAGHSERGLSLLMQCVALHPGYADAYNNLGQRFRLAIRGGSPTSR